MPLSYRLSPLAAAVTALVISGYPPSLAAQRPTGQWQGTVHYDSLDIPFPLEWRGTGAHLTLSLFNGATPITSTKVTLRGDSVVAEFAQLAAELRGTLHQGHFSGSFGAPGRTNPAVTAAAAHPRPASTSRAPAIDGTWILPTRSSKGEDAWRFIVTQHAGDLTATILRIDGDAGALVGRWEDSAFVLHHFDGTRPARLVIHPLADSALDIAFTTAPRGVTAHYRALRPDVAEARGVPKPSDFASYTTVRDLEEPFHFAFPGLDGKLVADSDARFRHKAVIVTIGGSWCPNCHDEAPFLAALYRKYRDQGLEVVSLDFEDREQLQDLSRVKAFVAKYGIEYPVLVAGATSAVHTLLPQAVNLNTWPATFFLGRDGKVKAVRAGFAAPASGAFHAALEKDYAAIVEGLLRAPVTGADPR